MKKLIALLAFITLPATAAITDLTIEFDLPTQREDGEPLAPGDISEVRFYDGCADGNYSQIVAVSTAGNPVSSALATVDWADNSTHSICFAAFEPDGTQGLYSPSYDFLYELIGRPGAGNIRNIIVTCSEQRCRVTII